MKNIKFIYTCCFMLLLSVSFLSCEDDNTAEDAHERLKVNKTQLRGSQNGKSETGNRLSIEVFSNRDFQIAVNDAWIKVDKTEGSGIQVVMIELDENTTGGKREGSLLVKSGGLTEKVTILQTTELSSDDDLEIGHVYLFEDFSWLAEFGGEDQVANPLTGNTTPLSKNPEANAARTRFVKNAYADFNTKGSCFYLAKHYLKMGKNNKQTGFAMTLKNIEAGKSTNMKLSFDVAPVFNAAGTSADKTEVTVEISSGSGTVNGYTSKVSGTLKMTDITAPNQWQHMEVQLYEVRPTTTVVIRSTQYGKEGSESGAFRWYLDNIKMEKTPLE